MVNLTVCERTACAQEFLQSNLTSREREVVVGFAMGYSQVELARALQISPPAVSQMVARIHRKATQYWA